MRGEEVVVRQLSYDGGGSEVTTMVEVTEVLMLIGDEIAGWLAEISPGKWDGSAEKKKNGEVLCSRGCAPRV
ncbi:hypothetical protein Tco_1066900 [Tanacetum coccineum]|uniref:Uncharacterized protein n=1 Tax=Tanacetum coccineum TaxID=301880 RepID=A0ABQ5HBQ1_9ASTR